MSANRPAFANSLVAMYGSSPETSDDEADTPSGAKMPPSTAENVEENSAASASDSESVKESQKDEDGVKIAESIPGPPKPTSSDVPETTVSVPSEEVVLNEPTDLSEGAPLETGVLKGEVSVPSEPTLVQNSPGLVNEDSTYLSEKDEKEKNPEALSHPEETVELKVSAPLQSLPDSSLSQETKMQEDSQQPSDPVDVKEETSASVVELSQEVPSDVINDETIDASQVNLPTDAAKVEPLDSISEPLKESKATEESELVSEPLNKFDAEKQHDTNIDNDSESGQIELNTCTPSEKASLNEDAVMSGDDGQDLMEKSKRSPTPEKTIAGTPGGRKLRQIRHPSAKAAEAAADAAFVAAATPSRKNLKEAKIASALAKASDTPDAAPSTKRVSNPQSSIRTRKGRSSSHERSSIHADSRTSPLIFSGKEDSSSSETTSVCDGKLTTINEDVSPDTDSDMKEELEPPQKKATGVTEGEKPVGIKLKISRESVQILDPTLSKLEVQIPAEPASSEVTCSPGGTKRLRKLKEGTLSPNPPLSPITLKIAKNKEGLGVVCTDIVSQVPADSEAKVEKITLKLSREEGATIVKPLVEEVSETRPEKLTLKLVKEEGSQKFTSVHSQDDVEEAKLGKIFLKLSKGDGACIVKRKEVDTVASSSDTEGSKLERITLKRSTDNNMSIVRSKDMNQLERSASASPEPGKVEKITLKVSKNDNISIVKPASPTPSAMGVEKLTLKVSKDGTAAVSGKQNDDFSRDGEGSKLEKITLKFSKEDGVSIVKPASPIPDKKSFKLLKEEPLSPLSPLTITRNEEVEPQKERITLKLSKAGGHPSPVGITDERSSWSIKSTDSDTVPSPVPFDPATPKSRPKRAMIDTPETAPGSAKRLKLSDVEKSDDSNSVPVTELKVPEKREESDQLLEEEQKMDVAAHSQELLQDPRSEESIPAEEISATGPSAASALANDSMEVILLDSEDSLMDTGLASESSQPSIPIIDVEDDIPTTRITRRKPRGRPRKAVLTPGSMPVEISVDSPAEDIVSPSKPKRERVRPEPAESDRPKRSCKGREKPPPKPVKPTKPRGRAALAKQKAEQTIQPEEPQLFEEETRMSADCGSQSETLPPSPIISVGNGLIAKVVVSRLPSIDKVDESTPTTPSETPADSPTPIIINEESQASQGSVSMVSSTTESTPNRGNRKGRMEINVDPDAQAEFTVDMIAEYLWPLNDGQGETYMIQEQISAYLGVKSFKRKYPNMQRRTVDHDERQYLLERKLVSESLCDLGLTALPSHEVLDVLCTDFPEKFEEYRRFTRERAQREFSNKQKAFLTGGPSGREDPKIKAMRNMASFNAMLNRSRRDQRRCCFDLQSFTVHYPEDRRQKMSIPNLPGAGPYPLALVPGQYTDFYKEYTPAELRYFPLNTVLYGPLLPHEMRMSGGSDGSLTDSSDSSSSDSSSSDSDSSGSDSDSDSDSSSESGDDSSSQVVAATVESQEGDIVRPDAVCRVCNGDRLKNKIGRAEPLVHCASCEKSGHLSCLDLTPDMMPHIRKYSWHCTDCKLCAQCNDTADEDKMLFCDMCDRGYHIYCVGLRKVPEGRWHCQECAVCASCAARDPGGVEASQNQPSQDTPTKAESPQWQHEFKKGDKGARVYVRTLCVPCSKLWKKGRYCRLCWKCFTNQPEEEGLINCSICDRWMHADCCRKAGRVIDVEKLSSYICELCQQKGVRVSASKSPVKLLR